MPCTYVLRRILAGGVREGLCGLRMSGICCASGSAIRCNPVHRFHCRGSGAASCWVYRCRESPSTPPGVLEPQEATWLRFLTLRPAVRGWPGSAASLGRLDGAAPGGPQAARGTG